MEKKEKKPELKKQVKRETLSRERVRQIQESALVKMRKRMFAMGITKMNDIL